MNERDHMDAFVKFGEQAQSWGQQYDDASALTVHSANRFRLRIVQSLLEHTGSRRILDVGCGSGEPLVAMLRAGHDAWGFDRSGEMVAQAKRTLANAGFPEERAYQEDMERIEPDGRAWDAVVALGSVYYARDFEQTMNRVAALASPGGRVIFSLRNELFSLFSLNDHTIDFFLRMLVPVDALSADQRQQVTDYLTKRLGTEQIEHRFQTVDDQKIRSRSHNPLTVKQDVLDPIGLTLEGLYFYHFHALPPAFEHQQPESFRQLSSAMERPTDWRGMVMASAFVVDARKPG